MEKLKEDLIKLLDELESTKKLKSFYVQQQRFEDATIARDKEINISTIIKEKKKQQQLLIKEHINSVLSVAESNFTKPHLVSFVESELISYYGDSKIIKMLVEYENIRCSQTTDYIDNILRILDVFDYKDAIKLTDLYNANDILNIQSIGGK